MIKRLIFLFLFLPGATFAQLIENFDDGDISDWFQSIDGRWAASDISPLNGAFSLHHIFNNTSADKDRVSIQIPTLDLDASQTIWRFKVKYEYNPSDGNNWSVFLVSDADASQMISGGNINGYLLSVNFTGSDDLLKLLKISSGSVSTIITTSLNWDDGLNNTDTIAIEVNRSVAGDWQVKYNQHGDFENLIDIGTGNDNSFIISNYIGIYYEYTSSADQLLWIDDVEIIGSVYTDTIAPQIDSANIVSSGSVYLHLNERIDSLTASDLINYSVDKGIGNADSIVIDTGLNSILLFFDNQFTNKSYYNIEIQNIKDENGNVIADTTIQLLYFVPEPFDVVVNEVMADPNPTVNLPEYEYIEIKNTTGFDINFTGWKLKAGTTIKDFPEYTLDSASYVTLCSAAASEYLDEYGAVLGFPSFPLISNSGAAIVIYDENNVVIDSINFNTNWYGDTEKQDGGWSLERLDPLNTCSTIGNWKASENTNGGTPGIENSVFASNQDNAPPEIAKLEIVSDNQLKIIFNEIITQSSLLEQTNYVVTDGVGNPLSVLAGDDMLSVDLIFLNSFPERVNLILSIENLEDECGNMMPPTEKVFMYYQAQAYDIVINEIMSDPDPVVGLPEYEYIEIKNTTGYDINLTGWKLKAGTTIKDFPEYTLDSASYVTLCSAAASEYLDEYGAVLGFPSFPLISNSGAAIVIYDENDVVIDSINFNTNWYGDTEKQDGGWSLERLDPLNTCSTIGNWKASENTNGGTPGIENSVFASNQDNAPPEIAKLEIVSDNQLKIIFNEIITQSSLLEQTNYVVTDGVGNPLSVLAGDDMLSVDLIFLNSFPERVNLILSIENLEDECGNMMPPTEKVFMYYQAQAYDIVINEIMSDPDPVVGLPEYEYIEIKNTTGYDINLTGWKLKAGTTIKDFPEYTLDSASYVTLCSAAASEYLDEYGAVLGFPSFPLISNSGAAIVIYDENDVVIDSINFNTNWYGDTEKQDGGWSLERLDPLNTCSTTGNWQASENINGGTPGIENSVFASNQDNAPPEIAKLEIVSDNQLKIIFNEIITQSSLLEQTNYVVTDGVGNPLSVLAGDDMLSVDLIFLNSFPERVDLVLSIESLEDECGNMMPPTEKVFMYYQAQAYDIVINEIMSDPDPVVGLPEYEYIEIKNTTGFDINLTGWKLKAGTTIKDFPEYTLDSASYVTLCSAAASEYLDEYGAVLGFPSFPLISNSGAAIVIYDENDVVIDSINFNTNWYGDTEKQDGGWSLERLDPLNTCSTTGNWQASENINGGTPGIENSVFASNQDNAPPEIAKLEIVSDNQLKIIFNEIITQSSLLEQTNYVVTDGVGNPLSVLVGDDMLSVDLIFLNSFPERVDLVLSIESLEDECGNMMPPTEKVFMYYQAQAYDIVINEILADPDPVIGLPEVEYVEIYNTSQYPIDLTGWWFQAGSTIKLFPSVSINPESYLILCSPIAVEALESFGNVVGINGFPALGNTGQTLIIRDKNDRIISSVNYNNEWYKNDYKAEGGWSLEQIDPMNPCGGENNWKASESTLGGTPGVQNSVFDSNPDTDVPELLRATVIDENNIKLFFSESIDSVSALELGNYLVNEGIGNPSFIDPVEPDYKSVILTFNSAFENNIIYESEITGGIFDCSGNEIATNSIARFSMPSSPEESDVVINEILFNPLAEGYDFVELYNKSEKTIDLADVYIAGFDYENNEYKNVENIAPEGFLLFPDEFIVITENPEIIQQQYFTNYSSGFIELNSMPSFNDDMGRVIIMDKIQQVIDDFEYNEDMHFALLATNEGVSLERINYNRLTNDKSNWHSASELVGFATPAYENSQYMELEDMQDEVKIEPEIFSPDNDGYQDVTNIRFEFSQPGYVANIKIFDAKGRLIRYLANNQLLSADGIISWDGLDENNQKAPIGIYVIYIELFDLEGNVKQYKKSVVVATKW